jgi:hypothetical protein|tara:strand:- start:6655 stop:7266 length:612 start_codon:yes stop_codon:yes gene_type:complete
MTNRLHPDSIQHLFDGPIPGQSLTNSPDQAYPWEKAPEFTSQKQLTEKIFFDLLKDENLETVTTLMANKIPVMDIAQMLLMTGFQKGKMNPDMMLTQLEPTAYMLLAIAEKAGIDPVLARDDDVAIVDDEDEDVRMDLENAKDIKNSIGERGRFQDIKMPQINSASVGPNIKKQIDTLDTSKLKESILQKQKTNKSLLAKDGG